MKITLSSSYIFLLFTCYILGSNYDSISDQTTIYPIASAVDLSHWKVIITTPREDGKSIELPLPKTSNYSNIKLIKDTIYNNNTNGSIAFYTFPICNTINSKSELKEQMTPGDNNTNWKFEDGV